MFCGSCGSQSAAADYSRLVMVTWMYLQRKRIEKYLFKLKNKKQKDGLEYAIDMAVQGALNILCGQTVSAISQASMQGSSSITAYSMAILTTGKRPVKSAKI